MTLRRNNPFSWTTIFGLPNGTYRMHVTMAEVVGELGLIGTGSLDAGPQESRFFLEASKVFNYSRISRNESEKNIVIHFACKL